MYPPYRKNIGEYSYIHVWYLIYVCVCIYYLLTILQSCMCESACVYITINTHNWHQFHIYIMYLILSWHIYIYLFIYTYIGIICIW